jgi:heme iron utilization protein
MENMPDKNEQLPQLRALIRQQRWAALSTVDQKGEPQASMVAYAFSEETGELYLHLSTLAEHTRNLLEHPQASLVISESDDGRADPQELARAGLNGTLIPIDTADPGYAAARACYLRRLPDAAPRFDFGDFALFRLRVEKVRYVGGFARAFSYRGSELLPG